MNTVVYFQAIIVLLDLSKYEIRLTCLFTHMEDQQNFRSMGYLVDGLLCTIRMDKVSHLALVSDMAQLNA